MTDNTARQLHPDLPDMEAYWMPFTGNRYFKSNPRVISRAQGVHCWTHDGKQLLDALGVSFADFFSAESRGSDKYFFENNELSEIGSGPISYRQVGSDLADRELQILYETYQPGADTGQSMLSHDAEEGGVILQGRLEVTVGEQVRTLSAGDAYLFNSRLPHRFRNMAQRNRQRTYLLSPGW